MIYFIMPVLSDSAFERKRDVLQRVLDDHAETGHFPMEVGELRDEFAADSVVADMSRAKQIIADLALERPSCYFEVGLAQGAGLPVDLIAPTGTPIHQVAGRHSVHRYSSPGEYEGLLRWLIKSTVA